MSNFLSDLASLSDNKTLNILASSGIGQNLSNSITSSVNKKLTPKPPAQVAPTIVTTSEVSVSNPNGMIKNILIAAGGVISLLVLIYVMKKKGRR